MSLSLSLSMNMIIKEKKDPSPNTCRSCSQADPHPVFALLGSIFFTTGTFPLPSYVCFSLFSFLFPRSFSAEPPSRLLCSCGVPVVVTRTKKKKHDLTKLTKEMQTRGRSKFLGRFFGELYLLDFVFILFFLSNVRKESNTKSTARGEGGVAFMRAFVDFASSVVVFFIHGWMTRGKSQVRDWQRQIAIKGEGK